MEWIEFVWYFIVPLLVGACILCEAGECCGHCSCCTESGEDDDNSDWEDEEEEDDEENEDE